MLVNRKIRCVQIQKCDEKFNIAEIMRDLLFDGMIIKGKSTAGIGLAVDLILSRFGRLCGFGVSISLTKSLSGRNAGCISRTMDSLRGKTFLQNYAKPYGTIGLASEVVRTIVAVVYLFSTGEPALELPYIALALGLLDEGHPRIQEDEDQKTNAPLDGDQDQVEPTENKKPKAAVLAFYIGKLNMCASALGTFLIQCHKKYLSISMFGIYPST